MEKPMSALTLGIDHLGLTVPNLEATVTFFTDCLGWKEVGGKPEYPSKFISDGTSVLTLWQAKTDTPVGFDRKTNIGLHHVAFKLESEDALNNAFSKVREWPGVTIECSPEFSGNGPKVHFFINEPGGNRLEFAFDPR
jgi:catechol 2,3-dioxygenase-like lactoylglutathione lyase family enzyme